MSPKNKYHLEIIDLIKSYSHSPKPDREGFGLKYVGTDKPSYHLNTKDTQTVAKDFLRKNKINIHEFHQLISSLYHGETYDEINIGAKIIQYSIENQKNIDLNVLDDCLNRVHGWAEVDTLCSMAFIPQHVVSRWPEWEDFLLQLNKDNNVHKRRASLVLLTKVVGKTNYQEAASLAIKNIDSLKSEKDILITKAISWLLRSMINLHRHQVEDYLNANQELLPRIAVREVTTKLTTGKKYINQKKNGSKKTN